MSEQGQPERLTATDEPSGADTEQALQEAAAARTAEKLQQPAPAEGEQLTDAEAEARDVGEPGEGITASVTTPVDRPKQEKRDPDGPGASTEAAEG